MSGSCLMLHGFGQTRRAWEAVIEGLDGLDCRAPDLRGHGSNGAARPIDEPSLVADAIDSASDLTDPILIGYSMGGRIALRAAMTAPDAFSALVLVSTSAGIESKVERDARRLSDERLAAMLQVGDMEGFERAWISTPVWSGDPEWLRDRSRELRRTNSPVDLAAALRGFGSGTVPPAWDRLASIRVPTLIVHGGRDRTYGDAADRLARAIPGAESEAIGSAGHCLPLEAPQELAGLIGAFTRRQLQAGPGSRRPRR